MDNPELTPHNPPAARIMSFVRRHKVGLTAVATATVTAVVVHTRGNVARDQMFEFITEKGLLEEYVDTHPIITK